MRPTNENLQPWLQQLATRLQQRAQDNLLRKLNAIDSSATPEITFFDNGSPKKFIQFASNNYLGLATDPEVIEAAREATARWGTGSGASRLVAGSLAIHHELEQELARFKHAEAALLFPSGFMANLAALTTFAHEGDLIVSDKLNHASLLDAARYSGAACRTFPHLNLERAKTLLSNEGARGRRGEGAREEREAELAPSPRRFVSPSAPFVHLLVTDTIFSMDGDTADLPALAAVARETARDNAPTLLITDEAHATGLLGATGSGLAEEQHVSADIALSVGTLSKALGSIGGFITGPQTAIDTLLNEARPFIYTTALPPSASASALAAVRIIQREPSRRQRVLQLAQHAHTQLTAMGYNTGTQRTIHTPIIPLILGSAETALQATSFLRDHGLFVPAIRPPTVPPNTARLRLSFMSTHTDGQVEHLLTTLQKFRNFHSPATMH